MNNETQKHVFTMTLQVAVEVPYAERRTHLTDQEITDQVQKHIKDDLDDLEAMAWTAAFRLLNGESIDESEGEI